MSNSNVVNLRPDKPRVDPIIRRYEPPKIDWAAKRKRGLDMLAICAGKTPGDYRDSIAPNFATIIKNDVADTIEAVGADRTIKILEDCLSFAKSQRG